MPRKLTPKQERFVAAWTGNATGAARAAGYNGSDNTLANVGRDLLMNPQIRKAIEAKQAAATAELIASNEQLQEFWTRKMREEKNPALALRASELLGKSHGMFFERHRLEGADGGPLAIQIVLGDGRGQS